MDNPYLNEWEDQTEAVASHETELANKLRRVMLVSRFFAVGGLLFFISIFLSPSVMVYGFPWAVLLYFAALALNITQANIARSYRRAIYARGGLLDSLARRARIGTSIAWAIVALVPVGSIALFIYLLFWRGMP